MTMASYDALYLLTLVTVAFGALSFSVLALFYWRERRSRPRTAFSAFTAFTEVCAAAFLINLLLRITPRWETPLTLSLDLITSLVPPLLLHMVTQGGRRPVLLGFYGISVLAALAAADDELNLASVPFRDQLPVSLLGVVGATGLFLTQVEPFALGLWYRALLGATMVVAAINLTSQPAFTILASDFLLLAFFCVTLYYQECLIFFDLLIKRAAFAALASTLVTAFCWLEHLPDPVTVGLGLTRFCCWGLGLTDSWADGPIERGSAAGTRRPKPKGCSRTSCSLPRRNGNCAPAPSRP